MPDPVVRLRPKDDAERHARAHSGANWPRNEGTPLRPDRFENARVNLSAVERRAANNTTPRTVNKELNAAWIVKSITIIDITTI